MNEMIVRQDIDDDLVAHECLETLISLSGQCMIEIEMIDDGLSLRGAAVMGRQERHPRLMRRLRRHVRLIAQWRHCDVDARSARDGPQRRDSMRTPIRVSSVQHEYSQTGR